METVSVPKSQAENIFKFSEPLPITSPSVDSQNLAKNEGFYKFSQPLDVLSGKFIIGAPTSLGPPPVNNNTLTSFGSQFKRSRKEWECNVCMVYNAPELENCVACKAPRKPSTLFLDSSFGQQFKKSADKWECETCMIQNTQLKTQCIACETPRSGSCKSEIDEGFKTLASQQKASKWECSACMTQNDNNCFKCVCCEQGKPGLIKKPEETKQSPALSRFTFGFGNGTNGPTENDLRKVTTGETAQKSITEFGFANTNRTPSDAGFKELASQQKASKWECTVCLTQNENKRDNCVCCGQQKPGQEAKEKLSRVPVTPAFTFGFGNVNNVEKTTALQQSGFQFGVKRSETMPWECGTCLVRNKPESTKCVCCESVRQNDSKIKTPTCTIFKDTETTKFKFGFGSSNTTPVVTDFKSLASQQKASKWECSTCMTQNDTNKVKCVCCEEAKPRAERNSGKTKPLETTTNFRFGFFPETKASTERQLTKELDCKISQLKKSATEANDEKQLKFGVTSNTHADEKFKALAAQQKASKWECDACMTQNDSTLVKCACCEQVKPGEKIEVKTPLLNEIAAPKFRFGFGDGNDAPTEEELRKKL